MMDIFSLFLDPAPLRLITKYFIKKFKVGNYLSRLNIGAVDRPHYGHCVYNAAVLGKKLGIKRISVLEFGVAGGKGLLNLEYHAKQIEKLLSIGIDIYGFDTGEGLHEPLDYRDLPFYYRRGDYGMDYEKLKDKLKKAKLVIGDIKYTGTTFFEKYNPSPIGAIMFDLDYYSSTVTALNMLEAQEEYFLPRVFCYFDDIQGDEILLFTDYTGERLAIDEFNQSHSSKKISKAYYFEKRRFLEYWHHRIYIFHNFKHSKYNDFVGEKNKQLPSS